MATSSIFRQKRDSWPLSRKEKKDLADLYFEREVDAQQATLLDDPQQVHQLAETVLDARRSSLEDRLSPNKQLKESELMEKLQWRRHVVDTHGIEFVKEGCLQSSPEKTPERLSSAMPSSHGTAQTPPAESPLADASLPKEITTCAITENEYAACRNAASLAGDIEDIDEADLSALDFEEQKAVKAAMEVLARVRAAKVAKSIMKQKRFLEQRLRQDQNLEDTQQEISGWSQGGFYREESPEADPDRRATSAPCAQWTPELERMHTTKGQARGGITPRKRRDSRGASHVQLSKSEARDFRVETSKPPKKRVSFGKREEVIITPGDGKDSDVGEAGKDETALMKRLARRRVSRGPDGRPVNLDSDSDDTAEQQRENCRLQETPKQNSLLRDCQQEHQFNPPKENALTRWWRRVTTVSAPSFQVAAVTKDDGDDDAGWWSAY